MVPELLAQTMEEISSIWTAKSVIGVMPTEGWSRASSINIDIVSLGKGSKSVLDGGELFYQVNLPPTPNQVEPHDVFIIVGKIYIGIAGNDFNGRNEGQMLCHGKIEPKTTGAYGVCSLYPEDDIALVEFQSGYSSSCADTHS